MAHDFQGRSALLVGGASQLGLATTTKLLEGGANVLLVDLPTRLHTAKADERLTAFLAAGALHLHPAADLAEELEVEAYVAKAVQISGGLDIAIFAAIKPQVPQDFVSISAEMYDETTSRSVRAVWLGVKHCARAMTVEKRTREGVFLFVSSSAGLAGSPGLSAFSMAQWAIRGLGQSASQEFAPLKIRTNTIHPVLADTTDDGHAEHARSEEVANVVAFLVSEKAGYVNGVTITVNGATVNWG